MILVFLVKYVTSVVTASLRLDTSPTRYFVSLFDPHSWSNVGWRSNPSMAVCPMALPTIEMQASAFQWDGSRSWGLSWEAQRKEIEIPPQIRCKWPMPISPPIMILEKKKPYFGSQCPISNFAGYRSWVLYQVACTSISILCSIIGGNKKVSSG